MDPILVHDDRRNASLRLAAIQYTVAVVFIALGVGFWLPQVADHERYREMAENNHLRTIPLRAPRGVLFDRHARVLVENRYSFNISIVPEQIQNLDESIRLLARVTREDEAGLREPLRRRRREPGFRPVVVVEDATLAQVAAVTARKLELPGVVVQQVPTRKYPGDELAAHLFGYVGEVTESQLERAEFTNLQPGAIVGQAGVEQAFNRLLMGTDGNRYVVVNSLGREIEEVRKQDAVEGRRLELTIDADLQRAAEDGFHATGFNGAAVFLDPRTGEVLSLVSLPAFDPNIFAVGIDRATWSSLNADRLNPLQNRAIQGRYSPGSTFKIVMATAALEEGVVTPDFKVYCPGGATFYGRYFQCHLRGGHGSVDMRHAIEKSCNVYFYTLGNMLSIDQIHKWAERLGLAGKTGIDLPHEIESLVPSSAWKLATTGERWYPGETISVAIGQGQLWVTPLAMAVMMATVANGGTRIAPRILKAVDTGTGWEPMKAAAPVSQTAFKPGTVAAIHDGLWLAVNGQGTAARARLEGRDVAGKTGTAQVISVQGKQRAGQTDKDLRDHGWFVFFAPKDNSEIAGVVFAEHAEHGYLAAPIARHVLDTYFAKREGRPLPQFPVPPATVVAANALVGGGRQ
jgi:penicillin-binding protein 2